MEQGRNNGSKWFRIFYHAGLFFSLLISYYIVRFYIPDCFMLMNQQLHFDSLLTIFIADNQGLFDWIFLGGIAVVGTSCAISVRTSQNLILMPASICGIFLAFALGSLWWLNHQLMTVLGA